VGHNTYCAVSGIHAARTKFGRYLICC
jgi:hypothetical protein